MIFEFTNAPRRFANRVRACNTDLCQTLTKCCVAYLGIWHRFHFSLFAYDCRLRRHTQTHTQITNRRLSFPQQRAPPPSDCAALALARHAHVMSLAAGAGVKDEACRISLDPSATPTPQNCWYTRHSRRSETAAAGVDA